MFLQDEIQRLHTGGKEEYKAFFNKYAPHFYREALISNAGDQKAAAKKVLAVFCKVDELLKTGKDDDKIAALLISAEQSNKIETVCLDAVWRSFGRAVGYETIENGQFANNNNIDDKVWHGGRKMETAKEHMTAENNGFAQAAGEENQIDDNLLVQEYPDTVIEGSEMEEKRKKMSKHNILMLIIMSVLILFLIWSILGIVLAVTPTTSHINIGFGPFINGIRSLFGW